MMNVTLVYGGRSKKLKKIVKESNEILRSTAFDSLVMQVDSFDMSSEENGSEITGNEFLQHVARAGSIIVHVQSYRPWWRFSKVNGYYKGGKTIYLNSRKFFRSEAEIANTMVHEAVHCLDNFITSIYVGHGDNSPTGKKDTTPWKIGKIIQNIYEENGHKECVQMEMDL